MKKLKKYQSGGKENSLPTPAKPLKIEKDKEDERFPLSRKVSSPKVNHRAMDSIIKDQGDIQSAKTGGKMLKRADGSYSQRGLWDNIRANKGSGKEPTKEMLKQEKKIKASSKKTGGKSMYNFLEESKELKFGGKSKKRMGGKNC